MTSAAPKPFPNRPEELAPRGRFRACEETFVPSACRHVRRAKGDNDLRLWFAVFHGLDFVYGPCVSLFALN